MATERKMNETAEQARDKVIEIQDDLREVAHRAGKKVRAFVDNASSEVNHAAETVTTQIRHKPVQSSLVALGVGFLIGTLFRR